MSDIAYIQVAWDLALSLGPAHHSFHKSYWLSLDIVLLALVFLDIFKGNELIAPGGRTDEGFARSHFRKRNSGVGSH